MASPPLDTWLDDLSARQPTPGGGAAAGLIAATAAALFSMVANYTTGTRYSEVEAEMSELAEELSGLRSAAVEAMDADATAFAGVGAAYAMAKESEEDKTSRTLAIQHALAGAAKPPLAVGAICARLVPIARTLASKGNRNVLSDVGVGAAAAIAALDGAVLNVAINASQIADASLQSELKAAIATMDESRAAFATVRDDVRSSLEGS